MPAYVESSSYWESARARGVTLRRTPETRVVIVGMEAVTPLGFLNQTMAGFREGRSGTIFKDVGNYYTSLQAPLPKEFDPYAELAREETRLLGHLGAIEVTLARRAGFQANVLNGEGILDEERSQTHRNRIGFWVGSGMAETQYLIDIWDQIHAEKNGVVDTRANTRRLHPLLATRVFPEEANGDIARILGGSGLSGTTMEACATGASNIFHAVESILSGRNDFAFAGGVEEALYKFAEVTIAIFAGLGALSRRNDEPEKASRPYDRSRDGFVAASGGNVFVLEGLEHAKRRGVPILAEVLRIEKSVDGYDKTELNPIRVADTIAQTIYDPSTHGLLRPDAIFAHATSTPVGDLRESEAFRLVFGEDLKYIPITAIKSFIGHTLGGAGAVNAAVATWALQHQELPHVLNLTNPDPAIMALGDFNFVRDQFIEHPMRTVLATAFGFGGYNCGLLLGRYMP